MSMTFQNNTSYSSQIVHDTISDVYATAWKAKCNSTSSSSSATCYTSSK